MSNLNINKIVTSSILALFITSIIVLVLVSGNPFFTLLVGAGITITIVLLVTVVLGLSIAEDTELVEEQGKLYDFSTDEGIEDYYNNKEN